MSSLTRRSRSLLILVCLLLAAPAPSAWAEELLVSAAASLTDAFNSMEAPFEAANPGVDVIFNYAASGALYRQIEQGAPVDVFASANPKWMKEAVDKGFVAADAPVTFARNALVIAVPAGNPAKVSGGLDTLPGNTAAAKLGIGTPETVPAGQYAKAAIEKAGLWQTLEPRFIYAESVRQVLDYLERGEVDAGFVYATDAAQGGDAVQVVAEIPLDKPVTYPIAVLKEAQHADMAKVFVEFVQSPEGLKLLEAKGFSKP